MPEHIKLISLPIDTENDAEPLLGGRAEYTEDTLIARVRRVFSCRRMLRLGEVAGC